jgi:hypothetical protein
MVTPSLLLSHGVLAVFDVDGVVADVRHRLHHLARRPRDWPAFFAAARSDPPLETGVAMARAWAEDHDLAWLTGRPEFLRDVTEQWLLAHGLPVTQLVMRPGTDRRPAKIFKAEQLSRIAGRDTVAVVVDDDPEVVELLARRGWPVYLADWVPYTRTLRQAQEGDGRT